MLWADLVFVFLLTLAALYTPFLLIDDLWRPNLRLEPFAWLTFPLLAQGRIFLSLTGLGHLRDETVYAVALSCYPFLCYGISLALFRRRQLWCFCFCMVVLLNSLFSSFILERGLRV